MNSARTALTHTHPPPVVIRRLGADEKALEGGKCQSSILCALTQKRLLLENVLVDKREQRRPRSVVVVIVVDGRAVSSFALQQEENQ